MVEGGMRGGDDVGGALSLRRNGAGQDDGCAPV